MAGLREYRQLRDAWGLFKVALAESLADGDLFAEGRVKQPAWTVLMRAADAWAQQVAWQPEPTRQARARTRLRPSSLVDTIAGCAVAGSVRRRCAGPA
jgi:hypothetical protein